MDRFVEQAVVLSTMDYGDADRLVTFFTAGRGKLTAFAQNARKSQRRFAGALEPMTLVRASLVERHSETFRLDTVDIEQSFPRLRSDLPRIARALYSVELCRELLREREPHLELFGQLVRYLESLEAGLAGPTSLLAFELDALARAGLMPRFDRCTSCGADAELEQARVCFDPLQGGVVCSGCQTQARQGLWVSSPLISALARLQRGERKPLPAAERASARGLLNTFIAHHIGRRLKSVDFMAVADVD